VEDREVGRGKYLAEEIANCAECYTPRDEQGELRREAWMQDAPIWISPVRHIPNWADQAPPIAGLSSFTEEQVLRVLEKGTGPQGDRAVSRTKRLGIHDHCGDGSVFHYHSFLRTKKSPRYFQQFSRRRPFELPIRERNSPQGCCCYYFPRGWLD
jgi:hypothetical protein